MPVGVGVSEGTLSGVPLGAAEVGRDCERLRLPSDVDTVTLGEGEGEGEAVAVTAGLTDLQPAEWNNKREEQINNNAIV